MATSTQHSNSDSANYEQHEPKYTTVLLVEDNEVDNFICEKLIKHHSFSKHLLIHTNGRNALEFLNNLGRNSAFPNNMIPDIIFLDINLPIMDGFQFLSEFEKQSERIKEHCKIIMLTSSVNPADVERAFNNKYVVKYISKPLTKEHLVEIAV